MPPLSASNYVDENYLPPVGIEPGILWQTRKECCSIPTKPTRVYDLFSVHRRDRGVQRGEAEIVLGVHRGQDRQPGQLERVPGTEGQQHSRLRRTLRDKLQRRSQPTLHCRLPRIKKITMHSLDGRRERLCCTNVTYSSKKYLYYNFTNCVFVFARSFRMVPLLLKSFVSIAL